MGWRYHGPEGREPCREEEAGSRACRQGLNNEWDMVGLAWLHLGRMEIPKPVQGEIKILCLRRLRMMICTTRFGGATHTALGEQAHVEPWGPEVWTLSREMILRLGLYVSYLQQIASPMSFLQNEIR